MITKPEITLVQFIINFLRPYRNLPEFSTCVLKALEKLGHPLQGLHSKDMMCILDETGHISDKIWDECDN